MITLFRRIRQKLIDSGSITKYLLYAAGEILLVVIGILIALQVNNWNEERKDQQKADKFVQLLIEDFEADLRLYEEDIQILQEIISRKDSIKAQFDTTAVNRESLRAAMSIFEDRVYNYDEPNTATIKALLSSGDIELMPDSVARMIRELHQKQIMITVNEAEDLHLLQNMYVQLLEDIPFSFGNNELFNDERMIEAIWEMRSEEELALIMFNSFSVRKQSDKRSLNRYQFMNKETIRVLNILKSHNQN